jgi:predicted phosphodiesterase
LDGSKRKIILKFKRLGGEIIVDEIGKMAETYKEAYIRQHGEAGYIDKLSKNAAWRKAHPDAMAEYAEKRSKKSKSKEDTVLLIGDLHIGLQTVDFDKLLALAKKYWTKNPVLMLGDYIDCGIDKGYQYDNKIHPQDQLDQFKELRKILDVRGWVLGNHGARIAKAVGLNPFKDIFGTPEMHEIEIGGRKFYINHGKSAALNAFLEHQNYVKWLDVDYICLGHSHFLGKITYLKGGKLCTLIRTGGFAGSPNYSQTAGYPPQLLGWCEVDTNANFAHLRALKDLDGEPFEI